MIQDVPSTDLGDNMRTIDYSWNIGRNGFWIILVGTSILPVFALMAGLFLSKKKRMVYLIAIFGLTAIALIIQSARNWQSHEFFILKSSRYAHVGYKGKTYIIEFQRGSVILTMESRVEIFDYTNTSIHAFFEWFQYPSTSSQELSPMFNFGLLSGGKIDKSLGIGHDVRIRWIRINTWRVVIIFISIPLLLSFLRKRRIQCINEPTETCKCCGYSLRGHHEGQKCPECGALIKFLTRK
jgi:hypothetical protein